MAEQETAEKGKGAEPALPETKGMMAKMLPVMIMAGAAVVFAAAGFTVSRLFGTRGQTQTVSAAQEKPAHAAAAKDPKKAEASGHGKTAEADKTWYYDVDPVVVNLDEPGVTRYVRLTVTLEIEGTWDEVEGRALLDQKKPRMSHWLTLYLANQTLESTRGEKNLIRMQTQIREAFNEGLFSGEEPHVRSILFKEFAIQ